MLGVPDPAGPIPNGDATCDVAELGTCVQLTARGELDLAAATLLRAAADRARLAPGRVVVLDLCGATLVDSSVVHFAMELDRRAATHGTQLVIVATARTKAVFGLVGADDLAVVEDEPGPHGVGVSL